MKMQELMNWWKDVLIDVVVTVLIIVLVVTGARWAEIAVWIYTPLMVGAKVLALFARRLLHMVPSSAPPWFFHALYAVNVGVLLVGARWVLAALWALIWALSVLVDRRRVQTTA